MKIIDCCDKRPSIILLYIQYRWHWLFAVWFSRVFALIGLWYCIYCRIIDVVLWYTTLSLAYSIWTDLLSLFLPLVFLTDLGVCWFKQYFIKSAKYMHTMSTIQHWAACLFIHLSLSFTFLSNPSVFLFPLPYSVLSLSSYPLCQFHKLSISLLKFILL